MDSQRDPWSHIRALPLLWLSLAFLAGILLATVLQATSSAWIALSIASVVAAFVLRRRLDWRLLFALAILGALSFGAARLQAAIPQFTAKDLAWYNGSEEWVEIQGVVARQPILHDRYVQLAVSAQRITGTGNQLTSVGGLLIVQTDFGTDWHYGDQVTLRGRLQTPPSEGDFSYREYLARQGVYSIMAFPYAERLAENQGDPLLAALYALRQRGVETLRWLYPSQEAALLSGILLGDESNLSAAMKETFNAAGTRHIIAISGFNISIIAALFMAIFSRWLGPRRGIWLTGGAIAIYALLVGGDPPVVRAAIMGLVGLLALRTGRQQMAINSLALTAAFMAMFNPLVLWDIGFQLSFSATLGLVLLAGPMSVAANRWVQARFPREVAKRARGPLNDYVFMTIAAQITTLPILLFYFQRLSLFSLPANLLVLPVQPALMVMGGLSLLAGQIWLPLGQLVAFFVGWLATYTIRVSELFGQLPGSSLSVSPSLALVLVYYAILAAVLLRPWWPKNRQWRVSPSLPLALVGTLCLWLWAAVLAAPDGRLSVTLLDVDGEAILVRSPTGRYFLINTGPSLAALSDTLRDEIPLGHGLDWLLAAGRQQDQIGALASGRLPARVEQIGSASTQIHNFQGLVAEIHTGDLFELGGDAWLEVVATGDRGAVLMLSFADFRALLPLGLDFDMLERFDTGRSIGSVNLLLLADGGYAPLNPSDWIAYLAPQQIWVAGKLPADTTEAVVGFPLLESSQYGRLHLSTDGLSLWLDTGG